MATPLSGAVDLLRVANAGIYGVYARLAVRYMAQHTGIPALLVAAVSVVVGFRVLKKTVRFAVEVAVVAGALFGMTEMGWLTW